VLIRMIVAVLILAPVWAAADEVRVATNPETGLLSWKVQRDGLSLELLQVLPDFVRAAYAARGLPDELIEGVVEYCVFGTIVVNESDGQLSYRVADWRYVTPDGQKHRIKTKSEWVAEWKAMGVPYNWSILPDDQTLEVGDWSQGFTTVDVPRDSDFDLIFSWSTNGERHAGRIENLRCAPEEPPAS
jgi:hypothetical protein